MKLYRTNTMIDNRNVNIEHDRSSLIQIHDKPQELPHSSDKTSERLQHIDMMDFQSKISMILRGHLKQSGTNIPLQKGLYGVKIILKTPRPLVELPLLDTMKSILDGIDSELIANDAYIYNCKIDYLHTPLTSRATKTRPHDYLDIEIIDLTLQKVIVKVDGLNTFVVPKRSPYLLYSQDDEYIYPHLELYHIEVVSTLKKDGFQIPAASKYSVKIVFSGAIKSNDLDNMAKCYLPILLEDSNVDTSNIVSLELTKICKQSVNGSSSIHIHCNPVQP